MATTLPARMAVRARSAVIGLARSTLSFPPAGPSRLPIIARTLITFPTSTRTNTSHSVHHSHRSQAYSTASPVPRPSNDTRSEEPRTQNQRSKSDSDAETETKAEFEGDSEPAPPNASAYQRLKLMTKKYGWWALGMYTALSSVDFSLCFLAVHTFGVERISPIFDSAKHFYREKRYGEEEAKSLKEQDLKERAEKAKLEEKEAKKGVTFGASFWTEVALAYAIHKTALLPFRAGLTVAWTPKLVGWLTRRGWVGKGGLTRAATHAQGKVRDASDRVKERVKRTPSERV